MKGLLVVGVAAVLIAAAVGAYLFLYSPSTLSGLGSSEGNQSPTSTFISISQTHTASPSRTSSIQVVNGPAKVSVTATTCTASTGKCVITLMNSGGTAIGATGCSLNGLAGVFVPPQGQILPGATTTVSCAPAAGGAVPIPGFHVEGSIQLDDGSTVKYVGNWA